MRSDRCRQTLWQEVAGHDEINALLVSHSAFGEVVVRRSMAILDLYYKRQFRNRSATRTWGIEVVPGVTAFGLGRRGCGGYLPDDRRVASQVLLDDFFCGLDANADIGLPTPAIVDAGSVYASLIATRSGGAHGSGNPPEDCRASTVSWRSVRRSKFAGAPSADSATEELPALAPAIMLTRRFGNWRKWRRFWRGENSESAHRRVPVP